MAAGLTVASVGDVRIGPLLGFRQVEIASDRAVTARAGQAGDIAASGAITVSARGAVALGALRAGGDLSLAGASVTLGGPVTSANAALSASSGNITIRDVAATGAVGIAATGAFSAGRLSGSALTVSARSVSVAAVTASGAASLTATAGDASLGDVTAGSLFAAATGRIGAGVVRVTGDATLGRSLALVDTTIGGAASLAAIAGDGALGLLSTGSLRASASGRLTGGALRSGGELMLSGASLSFASVEGAGDVAATARTGDAALGRVASRDLTASAAGRLTTGAVTATGGATLQADSISAGDLSAAGDVGIAARRGDADLGALAANALTVTAAGALRAGPIAATQSVALTAQSLALGAVTAGGGSPSSQAATRDAGRRGGQPLGGGDRRVVGARGRRRRRRQARRGLPDARLAVGRRGCRRHGPLGRRPLGPVSAGSLLATASGRITAGAVRADRDLSMVGDSVSLGDMAAAARRPSRRARGMSGSARSSPARSTCRPAVRREAGRSAPPGART